MIKTKDLDSQLAKLEGGKSIAKVGDVREIRKKLDVLIVTNPEVAARYRLMLEKNDTARTEFKARVQEQIYTSLENLDSHTHAKNVEYLLNGIMAAYDRT